MIKLDVEKYCHDCPYFKAETDKSLYEDIFGELIYTGTTIQCKHRERCGWLHDYLEKKYDKNI